MIDIVPALRRAHPQSEGGTLQHQAADEIERLREQIYESIPKWQANKLQREIERLHAALRSIANNAANIKDAARKGRLWAQIDSAQIKGERHGNAKLTAERVRAIRSRVRDGASQRAAAAEFGISQFAVWAICARVRWSHVE
jgi:predicted DNA-binding protein (UPF0251 family)